MCNVGIFSDNYCNSENKGYRSGFQCKSNEQCLPRHWVCDGEDNCDDGSDENSQVIDCCKWNASDFVKIQNFKFKYLHIWIQIIFSLLERK